MTRGVYGRRRLDRLPRGWPAWICTFVAYVATTQLFSVVSVAPENVALLWLPNAVVAVALVRTERRSWWAIWIAGLLGEVVGDALQSIQPLDALRFGVVNMIEATLVVVVAERIAGPLTSLRSVRAVAALVFSAIAVPGATGMLGALGSVITFGSVWSEAWRAWWFGDAIGLVVGVPLGLALFDLRTAVVADRSPARRVEFGVVVAAVSGFAFALALADRPQSAQHVAIAGAVVAALGLGSVGAAAGAALIAVIAIVPEVREVGTLSVIETQGFLFFVTAAVLFVGATVEAEYRSLVALGRSEARFRTTFENAPIGMAITEVITSETQRWSEVNPALARTLGYSADTLLQVDPESLVHPDDRHERTLATRLAAAPAQVNSERRYRHGHGHYIWCREVLSVIRDPVPGRAPLAVTQLEDVTAAKGAAAKLTHAALHDSLTGLPNRVLLMDRLTHEIAAIGRGHDVVAVLYVDIDHFKQVNDTLGHDAGDALLVEVARRLETEVRPDDTVARIGGDEFVIVCGHVDNEDAVVQLAERVSERLNQPTSITGREVEVSGSIGAAVTRDVAHEPTDLLRSADAAMYQAKRRGRGRFELSSETSRRPPSTE